MVTSTQSLGLGKCYCIKPVPLPEALYCTHNSVDATSVFSYGLSDPTSVLRFWARSTYASSGINFSSLDDNAYFFRMAFNCFFRDFSLDTAIFCNGSEMREKLNMKRQKLTNWHIIKEYQSAYICIQCTKQTYRDETIEV